MKQNHKKMKRKASKPTKLLGRTSTRPVHGANTTEASHILVVHPQIQIVWPPPCTTIIFILTVKFAAA